MSTEHEREFGERIQQLVEEYGGTRAFARLVGVSDGIVRRWREGQTSPTASLLRKVVNRTGVELDWLVLGQEPRRREPGTQQPYGTPGPDTLRIETRTLFTRLLAGIELAVAAYLDGDSAAQPVVEATTRAEQDSRFQELTVHEQQRLNQLSERGYARGLLLAILLEKTAGRDSVERNREVQTLLGREAKALFTALNVKKK